MPTADFVLVDTSAWVEHLRKGSPRLKQLLLDGRVCTHDMIIAELALGNVGPDSDVFRLMQNLYRLPAVQPTELLHFIKKRNIAQQGIGYVDANLLASAALRQNIRILTHDRHLASCAQQLDLAY